VKVALIAAVARNGTIGRDGALPWRLSADLRRFKRLTSGHAILMGRRTWESIGKPLSGRLNIVVTRQASLSVPEEVAVVHSLAEGLRLAAEAGHDEVFVIGGASLYAEALPVADRLHLTEVDAEVAGDVSFPHWDRQRFEVTEEETVPADERNEYPSTYRLYVRRGR
jgi:dihydrofolate reductase